MQQTRHRGTVALASLALVDTVHLAQSMDK